jgi:predicted nucleic acid-binding protein
MTGRTTMLDTNVVSELLRVGGSAAVARFVAELPAPLLSVAVFHELGYGVDLLPFGARKARMSSNIETIRRQFTNCIVEVDATIARLSGELRARVQLRGGELKPIDALIAASALTRTALLATRNLRHFQDLGIDLVNPWDA